MTSYQPSVSFYEAAKFLSTASSLSGISNDIKLELYGLFKLLTVSPDPLSSRPSIFDFANRTKWDSWKRIGEKWKENQTGAEERYLELASNLGWKPGEMIEDVPQLSTDEKTVEDILAEEYSPGRPGPSRESGDVGMGVGVSTLMQSHSETDMADTGTIHAAVISGDVQRLIKFLSTHGTSGIDSPDEYGFTPLHLACDRGFAQNVRVLLDNGADTSVKDPDGFTAIDLAKEVGHEDIISLLQALPASSNG